MSAAELFMNRKTQDINKICSETLEGHQRAIMGTLTVEDIYKNRAAFSEQVLQVECSLSKCHRVLPTILYLVHNTYTSSQLIKLMLQD